uniref:Integrase catalytic domain-containing protein n=1 Tax=Panagrolaimus sp. ES5 TaxID=591445 RepID=A0AC34GXP7_9BILA
MDLSKLQSTNNGMKYGLVACDVLSRRIFCKPIKTKSNKDVAIALEDIIKEMGQPPLSIFSDAGTEFNLKQLYDQYGIEKYTARRSTVKAAYGLKPSKINDKNWKEVWNKLYADKRIAKARFEELDTVKLATPRKTFDKSYLSNYSDALYTIYKVNAGDPATYFLKNWKGQKITGRFYAEQLTHASEEMAYRVQEILKTRIRKGVKECFFQRLGYYENVRRFVYNKIEEAYKKKGEEKPFLWTKNEENANGILYLIHPRQNHCKKERKWQSIKVYPRIIRTNVRRKIEEAYEKRGVSLPFEWTAYKSAADGILVLMTSTQQSDEKFRNLLRTRYRPQIVSFVQPLNIEYAQRTQAARCTDIMVKEINSRPFKALKYRMDALSADFARVFHN